MSPPPLEAHAPRALPGGLAIGPNAAHAVTAQGPPLCKGYGRRRPVAGLALAHAHTDGAPLAARAEAQEPLRALSTPRLAVSRRRPGGTRPICAHLMLF